MVLRASVGSNRVDRRVSGGRRVTREGISRTSEDSNKIPCNNTPRVSCCTPRVSCSTPEFPAAPPEFPAAPQSFLEHPQSFLQHPRVSCSTPVSKLAINQSTSISAFQGIEAARVIIELSQKKDTMPPKLYSALMSYLCQKIGLEVRWGMNSIWDATNC